VDWYARLALARRAFRVGGMDAGDVLELELGDVLVDQHETFSASCTR